MALFWRHFNAFPAKVNFGKPPNTAFLLVCMMIRANELRFSTLNDTEIAIIFLTLM